MQILKTLENAESSLVSANRNNPSLRADSQNRRGNPPLEKPQNLQSRLPRFAFGKSCNDNLGADSANRTKNAESNALYRKIANYAIACITFLICVFNPYALYGTDITQFDSTQTIATLGALFGVFLTASFIAIYAVSFIPKRFAKIPAFIFSLALFIGLIYSFILVGDYGAMDHFSLQKTPFDDRDALVKKAREFVAVVAFGVIFIALALKKLLRAWQIILITLFAVSAINATNIALQRLDSAKFAESSIKSPPPFAIFATFFLLQKREKYRHYRA